MPVIPANDGFVVNRISRLRNDARIQADAIRIVNSDRGGLFNSPVWFSSAWQAEDEFRVVDMT